MKLSTSQLIVFSFFLLAIPLVIAADYRQSTVFATQTIRTNSTNCTTVTQIGHGTSKGLGYLTYTNSTIENSTLANQTIILRYGTTSSVTSNASSTTTSLDATSYSAKYVGICVRTGGVNATPTAGAAIYTTPTLSWTGGGAIDDDTLAGLPNIGSDVGGFLKNLAPGVGAFIIILGIFGAIAAIIFAIVGIVKHKITV
ncbi:hypothetical protein LCGC14_0363200 [marine sediment metagenome]|uniref:Uncharacterized protein n=1 Tax=marine sediment metagenome TaxID=412755 RepID=A0A0F9TD36_9ZZZZ